MVTIQNLRGHGSPSRLRNVDRIIETHRKHAPPPLPHLPIPAVPNDFPSGKLASTILPESRVYVYTYNVYIRRENILPDGSGQRVSTKARTEDRWQFRTKLTVQRVDLFPFFRGKFRSRCSIGFVHC